MLSPGRLASPRRRRRALLLEAEGEVQWQSMFGRPMERSTSKSPRARPGREPDRDGERAHHLIVVGGGRGRDVARLFPQIADPHNTLTNDGDSHSGGRDNDDSPDNDELDNSRSYNNEGDNNDTDKPDNSQSYNRDTLRNSSRDGGGDRYPPISKLTQGQLQYPIPSRGALLHGQPSQI
jgi:hypothetical protein